MAVVLSSPAGGANGLLVHWGDPSGSATLCFQQREGGGVRQVEGVETHRKLSRANRCHREFFSRRVNGVFFLELGSGGIGIPILAKLKHPGSSGGETQTSRKGIRTDGIGDWTTSKVLVIADLDIFKCAVGRVGNTAWTTIRGACSVHNAPAPLAFRNSSYCIPPLLFITRRVPFPRKRGGAKVCSIPIQTVRAFRWNGAQRRSKSSINFLRPLVKRLN